MWAFWSAFVSPLLLLTGCGGSNTGQDPMLSRCAISELDSWNLDKAVHLAVIERARIVPRFNTPLEVVRVLGLDRVLVPRSLVPVADALLRGAQRSSLFDEERARNANMEANLDPVPAYARDCRHSGSDQKRVPMNT